MLCKSNSLFIFDCRLICPIWLPTIESEKYNEVKVQSSEKREALVASCVVCHGVQEAQRGPILNGMENWYLREIRSINLEVESEDQSEIDRSIL